MPHMEAEGMWHVILPYLLLLPLLSLHPPITHMGNLSYRCHEISQSMF